MSHPYLYGKLLPGEKVMYKGTDIVLTTHRLRSGNRRNLKSIMLIEITSCRLQYKDNPLLLLFGFVCLGVGIIASLKTGREEYAMLGGLLVILLLLVYFQLRRRFVEVATPSTSISIYFKANKREAMVELMDNIELAKQYQRTMTH